MANKQTTITVGVQFEAAANSYANIVKEFQGAFKSINLDSTVGKQLNRIINSMGEKLQQARTIISGGVGSEITNKEMNKFLSLLESMNTMANRFQYTMNNINVDSLNLDAGEIARLKQARNEVSKLATQIENLQNNSATIGQLFKGDAKSVQTLKATNAGIKDSFTLSQALDAAKQKYADLGKEAKNAALGLYAANQALGAAKQYVAQLQNQTKEGAGRQAIADALTAPLTKENARFKLATAITRQQATGETNPFENSWYANRDIFGQYFRKNADGTFSDKLKPGGKEALETYLTELGLDDKQISSIVKNAENRFARLRAELTKVFQDKKLVDSFGKYAADTTRTLTQQGQESWTAEMAKAKAQETAMQKEVSKYSTASATANQAMTTTQEAIKILEQRVANQDKEIEELRAKLAEKVQDEADVESGLRDKYKLSGEDYSGQARGITNRARQEADAKREEQRLAAEAKARQDQAAQETEQFQQRLQNSLKQWMGVTQIVNIVRNGIRNAYQDIQNLDKAITNIAVVTDMSISDLWGKINEYMSIAQQYGVTTQGVYEVSQLYYQQGLATADVMELTTETLKMARISGMNYADAADAMTVAIRGFKMEMTDAQRVTDVYSEVAAVTASDTEELATAMSKTASSAASVGMSFENTTAMIATMVEATRESATNIGSAMKSIISR